MNEENERIYHKRLKVVMVLYFVNVLSVCLYMMYFKYPLDAITMGMAEVCILSLIPYLRQMRIEKDLYLKAMAFSMIIGGNNERK